MASVHFRITERRNFTIFNGISIPWNIVFLDELLLQLSYLFPGEGGPVPPDSVQRSRVYSSGFISMDSEVPIRNRSLYSKLSPPSPSVICLLHKYSIKRGFLNPSLCSAYANRQLSLAKAGRSLHLSIHINQSTPYRPVCPPSAPQCSGRWRSTPWGCPAARRWFGAAGRCPRP